MKHYTPFWRVAIGALLLGGCEDAVEPADSDVEVRIAVRSGNNQVGPAGTTLPQPLSVVVTNRAGSPVSGVPIRWSTVDALGDEHATELFTDASGVGTLVLRLSDFQVFKSLPHH